VLCPGCNRWRPSHRVLRARWTAAHDLEGSAWPTTAKTSEASVVFASDGPGIYRFTLTAVNGDSVQETFVVGRGA